MLQLFKKQGRSNSCNDKIPDNKIRSSSIGLLLEDDNVNDDLIEFRSRLSMNLVEIIRDPYCLSYFVQFLETKKALSLIKFYLDAENFKTAMEISLPVKAIQSDAISDDFHINPSLEMTKSFSSEAYDSLSYTSSFDVCDRTSTCSQAENNVRLITNKENQTEKCSENSNDTKLVVEVPELKALCDLSMRKPLTDDEKSQIFQSNKRKSGSFSAKSMEKSSSAVALDAVRIYRKYLTLNSPYYIDIPATIFSSISLALCADKEDETDCFIITSDCFEEAQKYILERLEKEYLNEFLESSFYCKYCVDILTSPGLSLSDILYSESALFYFMEYLEQEHQRDCLEFWLAATNFRKHYESNLCSENEDEATKDAMILYEKYFSLQSLCQLKFSDRVRSQVEECICDEPYKVVHCFDLPLKIIEKHIETKYFKSFLRSQLFTNYLTEMKSKITDHKVSELSSSVRKCNHRKTRSDCSVENTRGIRNSFISQHNTLLAMESSKNSKAKKLASADMQIDSRQLTDPDLLWHRNSTGGLSFGRVDSLGRYERDFDLGCPDEKWSLATGGNKIKNAVRKLVNLPEDKVQEEIAWQVAEMIVKDITSITLATNNQNS